MIKIDTIVPKGIKYHKGHEGEPLAQCDFYINRKKAVFYSDGDCGEEVRLSWYKTSPVTEEEFIKWVEDKHLVVENYGVSLPIGVDLYLSQIIDEFEKKKKLIKTAKKKVVFKLEKDKDYSFRTLNRKEIDKDVKEYFKKMESQSNQKVFVFVRDRFIELAELKCC